MTVANSANAANGDYAEREGKKHLAEIKGRVLSDLASQGLLEYGAPRQTTLVAINVCTGDYVLGSSDLDVMDKFQDRFGPNAIGWIADLAD